MNKAFVREPDEPPPRCPSPPGCGTSGEPISRETLDAQLSRADADRFPSGAFWCATPGCPIAYFDGWGTEVTAEALSGVPYPKNPGGLACSCLGIPPARILEEAREDKRDAVLRIIAHARSDAAECVRKSPEGRSCERVVRQLFMQSRRADETSE